MDQQMEPNSAPDQKQETIVPQTPPKSKLPLFLIGGLLLALVLVGGYKLMSNSSSPPPQPTPISHTSPSPPTDLIANWKTYTNTEFGYSLKYPTNWFVNPNFGSGRLPEYKTAVLSSAEILSNSNRATSGDIVPESEAYISIVIEGEDKATNQTLEDYIANLSQPSKNLQAVKVNLNQQIGGIKESGELGSAIHIANQNRVYSIFLPYSNGEAYKSTINQILSTFTFLNQNVEKPTESVNTTWKTFNDTNSTFSISYPNDWITTENNSNGIYTLGMGKGSSGSFMYGGQSILLEVALTDLTNEEYIKNNIAPRSNPLNLGNININSIVGEKWSFNDDSDSDNYAIFFVRNGKRYVLIKELGNKSQFPEYNLEIENVLSTFTFLQ